jgi:hypothetical protein
MDIKDLYVTIQCLIQEGINKEYIPYVLDLREMELYPRYLQHKQNK